MTVRTAQIWTCNGCNAEEEVEVHVSPSFLPPPGWGQRDGGDLCMDCLVERNRAHGGGHGG